MKPTSRQGRARPGRAGVVVVGGVIVCLAVVLAVAGRREQPPVLPGQPAGLQGQAAIEAPGDSTLISTITGGPFEPSGVAHVPGSNYALFVDDGRTREILLMEIARDGKQVGAAVPIALGADVRDLEAITSDGHYFYVAGSQSKTDGFEGDGLVRFTFDVTTRRTARVERIQGLKAWLAANVPELRGTANEIGDEVLNIEGMAWDAGRRRLLLGLRAPQIGGDALIIPVSLTDSAAAFSRENLRFNGPTIRVALGGAGIRSIEYDSSAKAFQIIAGSGVNEESRDFKVYEWSGESGGPLREIATFASALKPEGFTRAALDGRAVSITVFDVGKFVVRE